MSSKAQICPHCGGLNSADVKICYRCQRPRPAGLVLALLGAWRALLGESFPMTRLLAGLCGVIFTFAVLDAVDMGVRGFDLLWGVPLSTVLRFGAIAPDSVASEPWRLLAAIYCHFGPLHALFNISALLQFGARLEGRVGGARLTCVFVATGVCGFALSHWWTAGAITAGASGGIFGISGALVGAHFAARDRRWKDELIQTLVMGAILALVFRSLDIAAHLGGLLAGLPLGYVLQREKRPARLQAFFGSVAGVMVVASVVAVAAAQFSPLWRSERAGEIARGAG